MSTLETAVNYGLAAIYVVGGLTAFIVASVVLGDVILVIAQEIARWVDRSKS